MHVAMAYYPAKQMPVMRVQNVKAVGKRFDQSENEVIREALFHSHRPAESA